MGLNHPKTSTATADLTSASLTHNLTAGKYPLRILGSYLKASVNITETVTSLVVGTDTNYTHTADTSNLSAAQNYFHEPSYIVVMPGETFRQTCTNANTTGTVYSTIRYREEL